MTQFTPIKTSRVSEEVLAQLKSAIIMGQFKAGDRLPSERELTSEFQVSRGVIREAIRVLEISGFLVIRQGHGGGAYVTDLTFNHVANAFLDLFMTGKLTMGEVTQVRGYIEPEVARLAALNIDPAHIELLEKVEAEERLPFKSDADRVDRLTRVHKVLAMVCGNHFFEAIIWSMLKLTAEVVLALAQDHNALHEVGEHRPIVDAVKAGDGERASEEMARHLTSFTRAVIAMEKDYRQSLSAAPEGSTAKSAG